MPRIFQSIRFRLSLAFSIVVFSFGTLLVGGLYLYQVNQLGEPVLMSRQINLRDPLTGQVTETNMRAVFQEDVQRALAERIEIDAYREALNELRKGSVGALVLLFFASFGTGYLLSGWTLRPVDRIAGVARDISATDLSRRIALRGPDDELKNLADTFDAMLERLQGSFEDQRRFVHEASHELRNPLAVAQTNLELALDGGTEEELRKAAEIAHRSTGRMSVLVDDLLEQARAGVPELKRGDVDLAALVTAAAEDHRATASQRNLSIETVVDDGDATVIGDGPALRRAVGNLVVNASRLAPEHSTITLEIVNQPECVLLSVIDEGPGIAPGDREAVFERFWRGSDPGAGSGLGLSLVRRIAERHGGEALLNAEPNGGSRFTLRLPRPIQR